MKKISPAFGLRNSLRAVALIVAALFIFRSLPPASDETLYQRTAKESIAPGAIYYHFADPFKPLNLDVIRLSRANKYIVVRPVIGDGFLKGLEPVSVQAAILTSRSAYPVAAINGDFFLKGRWEGIPVGVMVMRGEIITCRRDKKGDLPRPAFVIYESGEPDITGVGFEGRLNIPGKSSVRIDAVNRPLWEEGVCLYTPRLGRKLPQLPDATAVVLKLSGSRGAGQGWRLRAGTGYGAEVVKVAHGSTNMNFDGAIILAKGAPAQLLGRLEKGNKVSFGFEHVGTEAPVRSAVGGGPLLVEGGRNLQRPGGDRHPRAAIGYNDEEIYMAVVDGRSDEWSRGMTLHELGELMLRMKCDKALNLDGGGSGTMWIRGELCNRVSDGVERPVSNALAVISSAPRTGKLERLFIRPGDFSILTEQTVRLEALGKDRNYNPVGLPGDVVWRADKKIGDVSPEGVFTSGSLPAKGKITARIMGILEEINVRVHKSPPLFRIYPENARLFRGDRLRFRYVAMDQRGLPLVGDYDSLPDWDVEGNIGHVDSSGRFRANNQLEKGRVIARLRGKSGVAEVTVGAIGNLLDDFEKMSVWRFDSYPDELVAGSFNITGEEAHNGRRSGKLKYRFSEADRTEAAYCKTSLDLGAAMGVRVWLMGDGSDNRLRLAYRNADSVRRTVAFDKGTLSIGYWHWATAKINAEEKFPVTLESIYVLKNSRRSDDVSGTIYLDEITGLYPPD